MNYPDFALILATALAVAAIFLIAAKAMEFRPASKETRGKTKIYACGEDTDPEKLCVAENTFYRTFIDKFKLRSLRKIHTGSLTDYLYWMFGAMIIIVSIMVLTW